MDPGTDETALEKVERIEGVVSAELAYGPYDLVVKIDVKSAEDLDSFIFERLRKIPGVKDTLTVITAKDRR